MLHVPVTESQCSNDLFTRASPLYRGGMQRLVRVKLSVEKYVREQHLKQIRPPSRRPNCERFHAVLSWIRLFGI